MCCWLVNDSDGLNGLGRRSGDDVFRHLERGVCKYRFSGLCEWFLSSKSQDLSGSARCDTGDDTPEGFKEDDTS